MSITLELTPSPVMQVFHVPSVTVECDGFADLEDAACNAYLLWQSEYPDYSAHFNAPVDGRDLRALNRRLFAA